MYTLLVWVLYALSGHTARPVSRTLRREQVAEAHTSGNENTLPTTGNIGVVCSLVTSISVGNSSESNDEYNVTGMAGKD